MKEQIWPKPQRKLSALSTRIQAIFPPGSNPPFIIRFDASSLPVGQLVLSSPIRSNNELQDMANIYVPLVVYIHSRFVGAGAFRR
jgi:hypothetical protein